MISKRKSTIGILGGMGPAASAEFYKQLITVAQTSYGAVQDHDFPPMHLYNLPLHGFDETGFVEPEVVRDQLIAGMRHLVAAGSDYIVIPCNTVHAFYDDMQNAVAIPIISIIDAVVAAVISEKYDAVGLLTSESTRKYKLFESKLAAKHVQTISPTGDEQRVINDAILNIMAGTLNQRHKDALKAIIHRLVSKGAQAVVIGCTELPLALTQADANIPLLSSTDILAHAALERYYR